MCQCHYPVVCSLPNLGSRAFQSNLAAAQPTGLSCTAQSSCTGLQTIQRQPLIWSFLLYGCTCLQTVELSAYCFACVSCSGSHWYGELKYRNGPIMNISKHNRTNKQAVNTAEVVFRQVLLLTVANAGCCMLLSHPVPPAAAWARPECLLFAYFVLFASTCDQPRSLLLLSTLASHEHARKQPIAAESDLFKQHHLLHRVYLHLVRTTSNSRIF